MNDEQIKKIKALQEKIIRASGNPLALMSFMQSEGLPVMIELLSIIHAQELLLRRLGDTVDGVLQVIDFNNGRLSNVESKE